LGILLKILSFVYTAHLIVFKVGRTNLRVWLKYCCVHKRRSSIYDRKLGKKKRKELKLDSVKLFPVKFMLKKYSWNVCLF
jgi:hypothetical protein